MSMRRPLLLLAVLAVILAACGDDEPVSSDGPSSTDGAGGDQDPGTDDDDHEVGRVEYRSVEVTADGAPRPLVEGTTISLHLGDDGAVGASLGCNSIGGQYRLEGDTLVVDEVSMTEMGCDPERHEQDEWFAGLLTSRPTLVVDGDTVTITGTTDGSRTTVVLRERSAVDPDRPLEGTEWRVTGFVDGDVAMSMAIGVEGRIRFEPDRSEAVGFDGCVELTVPYEVDGDDLRFGSLDVADEEAGACPPETEQYQERFRRVLVDGVEWTVDADTLRLHVRETGQGVTFRAVE